MANRFSQHRCAFGTPLVLHQGMPRLTSYHLIASLILPCIYSPSWRIRHAPAAVPGDATTDKLLPLRALDSPLHSFAIDAHLARPWSCTGDATTDKLLPLRALNSPLHSFAIDAHLARHSPLCQGMPRLTSYQTACTAIR
jgi:hypothetical protein